MIVYEKYSVLWHEHHYSCTHKEILSTTIHYVKISFTFNFFICYYFFLLLMCNLGFFNRQCMSKLSTTFSNFLLLFVDLNKRNFVQLDGTKLWHWKRITIIFLLNFEVNIVTTLHFDWFPSYRLSYALFCQILHFRHVKCSI